MHSPFSTTKLRERTPIICHTRLSSAGHHHPLALTGCCCHNSAESSRREWSRIRVCALFPFEFHHFTVRISAGKFPQTVHGVRGHSGSVNLSGPMWRLGAKIPIESSAPREGKIFFRRHEKEVDDVFVLVVVVSGRRKRLQTSPSQLAVKTTTTKIAGASGLGGFKAVSKQQALRRIRSGLTAAAVGADSFTSSTVRQHTQRACIASHARWKRSLAPV